MCVVKFVGTLNLALDEAARMSQMFTILINTKDDGHTIDTPISKPWTLEDAMTTAKRPTVGHCGLQITLPVILALALEKYLKFLSIQ